MIFAYSACFAAEHVDIKSTVTDKYVRLFFYYKQPIEITSSLNGTKLKISFSRDIMVDSTILESVSADISASEFNKKDNALTITLASDAYKVRRLVNKDSVVVDIIKPSKHTKIKMPETGSGGGT